MDSSQWVEGRQVNNPGDVVNNLGGDFGDLLNLLTYGAGSLVVNSAKGVYGMGEDVFTGTHNTEDFINALPENTGNLLNELGTGLKEQYHLGDNNLPTIDTLTKYPLEHPLYALLDALTLGEAGGALAKSAGLLAKTSEFTRPGATALAAAEDALPIKTTGELNIAGKPITNPIMTNMKLNEMSSYNPIQSEAEAMQSGLLPGMFDSNANYFGQIKQPDNLLDLITQSVNEPKMGSVLPEASSIDGAINTQAPNVSMRTPVDPAKVTAGYSNNLIGYAIQKAAETNMAQDFIQGLNDTKIVNQRVFKEFGDKLVDFFNIPTNSRFITQEMANLRQAKLDAMSRGRDISIAEWNNNTIWQQFKNLIPPERQMELIKSFQMGGNALDDLKPIEKKLYDTVRAANAKIEPYLINAGLETKESLELNRIHQYASLKNNGIAYYNLTPDMVKDATNIVNKMKKELPIDKQPLYLPIIIKDKEAIRKNIENLYANQTEMSKLMATPGATVGRKVGGMPEDMIKDIPTMMNVVTNQMEKAKLTDDYLTKIGNSFGKPVTLSERGHVDPRSVIDGYSPINLETIKTLSKRTVNMDLEFAKRLDKTNIDQAIKTIIQHELEGLPDDIRGITNATKQENIIQLPDYIIDNLRNTYTLDSSSGVSGLIDTYDKATNMFKRNVLGLTPKWILNSRIGNTIFNALKGVGPVQYAQAQEALTKYEGLIPKELSVYSDIGRLDTGMLPGMDEANKLLSGELISSKWLKDNPIINAGGKALGWTDNLLSGISNGVFEYNAKFENLERTAAYLKGIEQQSKNTIKTFGQNTTKVESLLKYANENPEVMKKAIDFSTTTLGNYLDMTAFERRVVKRIIPFYSWLRALSRFTTDLTLNNPSTESLMQKLTLVIKDEQKEANKNLPEYMQGAYRTGIIDPKTGKERLYNFKGALPMTTFAELGENPIGQLNPALKIPLEAALGQNTLTHKFLKSPNYIEHLGGLYDSHTGERVNNISPLERAGSMVPRALETYIPGVRYAQRLNPLAPVPYETTLGGMQQEGRNISQNAFNLLVPGYYSEEGSTKTKRSEASILKSLQKKINERNGI